MTTRHVFISYCQWVWRQWTRLSAFFLTTCIVAAMTVALAQTTRKNNALSARLRASTSLQAREQAAKAAKAAAAAPAATTVDPAEARDRARVVRLLEEIRDRLPEPHVPLGPLSSSH